MSVESRSAGVAVVSSETRFADAGPGLRVRPAGVVHGTGCAALTVCTEQRPPVTGVSTEAIQRAVDPLTDDLACWFGLSVVVAGGGVGGDG